MYEVNNNYDKIFQPGNLFLLFKFLKGGLFWFILGLVCATGGALLDVAAGYFIKEFINAGLEENFAKLLREIGLFTIFFGVNIVIKFMLRYTGGKYTYAAIENLRNKIYNVILLFSYSHIENTHSGDFVTRLLNDVKSLEQFYLDYMLDIIYMPLVFFTSFIYLFRINSQLTFASVVVIPITLLLTSILSGPVAGYVKDIREGQTEINTIAQKTTGNMDIIKIFRLNDYFSRKFKTAVNKEMNGYLKKNFLQMCLLPLSFITILMPFFITLVWGGVLILNGEFSAGELFAFLYLLQFMTNPLQRIPDMISEGRGISVSAGRIKSVLNTPPEPGGAIRDVPESTNPVISAKDITFSYTNGQPVLKHISFQVPEGKTIAFAGESGCGKSTLFKLLLGLYPPDSGSLKMYGREYSLWELRSLRNQFALVSQHPFLFPVSLGENISYGNPDAGINEIEHVCETANAAEFIKNLPEGLDTNAGERGANLSGGERQRITIARALLKDAPILLLDEPTASLDSHSESVIQEALRKIMKNRTVLVIAHRLSTIREADTILVLQAGRIVERGKHTELLEKKGVYHALYIKQANES